MTTPLTRDQEFLCDSGMCRRIAMREVEREARREIGREL